MRGLARLTQDRPVYGFGQVDRILELRAGTSQRWIDGYRRGGKGYPPVIRTEQTGAETVTWGELIEARLLAEYRDEGVPLVKMRAHAQEFADSLHWDEVGSGRSKRSVVTSLNPDPAILDVVVNPLQRFGEPSTRGAPTEVIRDLYVAGDPIEMIAELYQLQQHHVEAPVRYELKTAALAS